jgi:hypothetical protein
MDIIDRLKKEKKSKSIFDDLIKKKEETEKKEEESKTKPSDIEVTQINQEKSPTAAPVNDQTKTKPVTEFRAEGMHELDMESLGESGTANIKVEYKAKVSSLIDGDKLDEAIRLLLELKNKLAKKSEE